MLKNGIGGGVLLVTNNRNGFELYEWLLEKDEKTYLYSDRLSLEMLRHMSPDIIVSYNYKHIIPPEIITFMDGNIINLHISYLPWNKGSDPNFWSFVDDTPKGVTIHKVDNGLDTGDILVQKQLEFNEVQETFRTSYDKLNREIVGLFVNNWEQIKSGKLKGYKQKSQGSFHTKKDLRKINDLKPDLKPLDLDCAISEYKKELRRVLKEENNVQ